jgi:hypothetical protein
MIINAATLGSPCEKDCHYTKTTSRTEPSWSDL